MRELAILGGLAAICIVLLDAFETIILPRRATGKIRLTRLFYVSTWSLWCAVAGKMPEGRRRETAFSFYGPLSLLLLMVTWALGLMVGFALLYYGAGMPFTDPLRRRDLGSCFYLSGTTLVTLGLGDIVPQSYLTRALVVVEAGMGLGFVALVISYLPVLYSAFSQREVTIALLDARAGSPPTAAELLRRHSFPGGLESLATLLGDWERWSAQLLESHISYALLCYFRSQHDNQSWMAALTAVLDTSALLMTVVDAGCARQAQLTFAMARHAIVDLIQIFALEPLDSSAAGFRDRLSPPELDAMLTVLAAAGLPLSAARDARDRLARLRGIYEGQVQAMSRYLSMPLPPFYSTAPKRDTWMKVANLRRPELPEDAPCHEDAKGLYSSEPHRFEDPHPF